ncbi:MAG: DegT/DnrJ/EryC1/StrS family aminotransferase [Alphaproteobacteria bacterium]|nr:DegT/DnrJ/EryC1/StrS family aminotransferase [Alphaproteobacteria bacterium]
MSNIPFIDLKTQQKRLGTKINDAISKVLEHGAYIMGPEIAELETKLAEFCEAKHAMGCSSGTDALLMPLMAENVGRGDAVFVPAFTFVASAEAIVLAGATPVFVDVLPDTFNISPASLKTAIKEVESFGLKPRGIISVDLFGQPVDHEAILAIAKENNLFVISDAAQSFGSSWNGKKTGSICDYTATSFFPAKPLGCYGDGGAVFTQSEEKLAIMKSIRVHGEGSDRYENVRIGINGRLDSIQAAVLLQKLSIFDDELQARDRIAKRYNELLKDVAEVPVVTENTFSAWAQYTLKVNNRDEVVAKIKEQNVPVAVYYPIPLGQQKGYKNYPCVSGGIPVCEALSNEVMSLPMHPYIDENTQDRIVEAVKKAIG